MVLQLFRKNKKNLTNSFQENDKRVILDPFSAPSILLWVTGIFMKNSYEYSWSRKIKKIQWMNRFWGKDKGIIGGSTLAIYLNSGQAGIFHKNQHNVVLKTNGPLPSCQKNPEKSEEQTLRKERTVAFSSILAHFSWFLKDKNFPTKSCCDTFFHLSTGNEINEQVL